MDKKTTKLKKSVCLKKPASKRCFEMKKKSKNSNLRIDNETHPHLHLNLNLFFSQIFVFRVYVFLEDIFQEFL